MLEFRGVVLNDIAELVFYLQAEYQDNLTIEECIHNVNRVLAKREVQHAVLTGIELDILAEKGLLSEPLQDIISRDEGLYGIDEVIALSIVNVYGSSGFTSYGYIDKQKTRKLKKINDHSDGDVNKFLDDNVGSFAAGAASRLTHAAGGDINGIEE